MILLGHFKLTDCTKTILTQSPPAVSCPTLMNDQEAAVTVRLIFKVSLFHFLAWETAMWGVLSLSDKLQSPASQNSGQISFVLQFRHLTILLIFLLLTALPRWNSENYFSSEWKRDTWKISLSLRIFPGDSRQCPVCCKLTRGESLFAGRLRLGWRRSVNTHYNIRYHHTSIYT